MVVHEMTEQECRAMLARTHIARLACARDNQPYVVPVHVEMQGAYLYAYSTEGQKIEWMRQNPLVCLEFDHVASETTWASVVVLGRYEELAHLPEYEDLRREAERLFQRRPMWWEPAAVPLEGRDYRSRVVFRIQVVQITGRRAAGDAAKASGVVPESSTAGRPRWLTHVLRLWRGESEARNMGDRRPAGEPLTR
jgi:uncharacterized protein